MIFFLIIMQKILSIRMSHVSDTYLNLMQTYIIRMKDKKIAIQNTIKMFVYH